MEVPPVVDDAQLTVSRAESFADDRSGAWPARFELHVNLQYHCGNACDIA
jgi:hypothetical protein